MNALALDAQWDPFPAADEAPVVAPEAVTGEGVTTPAPTPHIPSFNYGEFPASNRAGAVPEALRPFMIQADPEGYTPPFYVNRGGTTRSAVNPIPGCPPIQPGGKALVFDDWGSPLVIAVTGMRNGEITGTFGTIPMVCRAWVAMSDEAPLSAPPGGVITGPRLTDEEAAALDAEFAEWSKFLGYRAEKYSWCGTFENILNGLNIKPWRPGYESVTLQIEVELDKKEILGLVTEVIGGESSLRSSRVLTQVVLKDVDRETFNVGNWGPLLKAAGYKNYRNVGVVSKVAMTL